MPAAVVAAIGTWVASITVTQVVFAVASFVISSTMASRAKKKAESAQRAASDAQLAAYNAGLVDRKQVIRSGVQPRNIVLGRDEASGPLWPWFTYGAGRNFHMFGVVLAGHECDAIETVMFNHEPVTLDGGGGVIAPAKWTRTVTATRTVDFAGGPPGTVYSLAAAPGGLDAVLSSGVPVPYSLSGNLVTVLSDTTGQPVFITYTVGQVQPLFYIRKYLGAPGQQAAPELISAAALAGVPGSWDASRKATGVCYMTVYMEADFNVLGQIGVPNISAIVRGVKAYDRSIGGAPVWSQNPAVLADWFVVTSGFSPKTLSSEVNVGELIASINVCNEGIYFSASRFEARYVCNGQLTSAASPLDNLNHILDSMDGDALWISGQWKFTAGYHKEPTLHLDEDKLSSAGISIAPYTAKRDLFNGLKGTYVNAAAGYARVGYAMVTSTVYQDEDGGELLPAEANFELVNDAIRCQMIAWQRLTRARQPLTLQLGTTLRGYDSAPLENVTVSLRRPGYVNKVFANLRREFDQNKLIYVMQETGPQVWAWDYSKANAAVDILNTSYPDVTTVPELSGFEVYSGTGALQVAGDGTIITRARLRWDAVVNAYVTNGGKIELRYKSGSDVSDDWISMPPAQGTDVEAFAGPLVDGDTMLFQGRCVTSIGRLGQWCLPVAHLIVGKTERPPDVISFSISADGEASWSNLDAVADLAGYQIRWHPGNNTSWGDATPLHQGLITDNPYPIGIRPSGVATFLIKAFDTSRTADWPLGNESVNAAASVINLGDPIVANVVVDFDYKAHGFPGTITNASVSGGDLVADADASPLAWDPNPNTAGWTFDTDPGWTVSTYKPVTYLPDVFIVDEADDGAQLTLPNTIVGTANLIEYRRDGDAPGWTTDAEPGWTDDADLAWLTENYRPWPGVVTARPGRYDWRVTIQSRDVQGRIEALMAQLDVADQFENVGRVSILAAGTVIPTAKTWRVVTGIGLTLVADGGTAESLRIEDEAMRLITARNGANVAVNGTALATLQGY